MNRAILSGHLGRDPEVRRLNDGRPVVSFSIATSERWRDKQTGERREKTEWHNVVIFNEALCKITEQYLKKGSKILLEGKIKTRKWQDKSGADRWSTEIVLESFGGSIEFLSAKDDGAAPADDGEKKEGVSDYATQSGHSSAGTAPADGSTKSLAEELSDEIPF
jgi:single-strand DNA-binding protein